MALTTDVMGGGFSSGQAQAINGQNNTSVSAAGTTISDATALKASHNSVTTVGASSGVLLPHAPIGDSITVYNGTATNALSVYPPVSSHTINQLTAGVAMLLSPYTAVLLKRVSSTAWVGWLSA